MGLTVKGISETVVKLRRTEKTTSKRLLLHMRNSAIKIRDLARALAPVDEGNLEDAIQVIEDGESFLGRTRKIEMIGVDSSRLGEGYTKYGHRYDVFMHEGSYNLGQKSQDKAAANGKMVGPKYLTRAWQELEPSIASKAQAIADDVARKS
jgi:hypothetical protein